MGLAMVYKVTVSLPDISFFMVLTPRPPLITNPFFILQSKGFTTEIDALKEKHVTVIQ